MASRFRKCSTLLLAILLFSITTFAQDDPDPNSPQPILLAGTDASRVLAVEARTWTGGVPGSGQDVFRPSQRPSIVIFLKGLAFLPGEDLNSLRVFIQQRSGRTFEMENVRLSEASKNTHALTLRLYDRSGYRGQPRADGDSLIYVTWRGNATSLLKIGLGSTGGMDIPPVRKTSEISGPTPEYVGYRWSGDRIRFAEQAAFGPSSMLDSRIRRIGIRSWVAEQFDTSYPTIPYPNSPQAVTNPPASCQAASHPFCYRETYTMIPLQRWFFNEAFYGQAQLRHRTAWTLGQIWVTSGVSISQASHGIAYQKILAENAFGNYRKLMYDVTLSPTMGQYLDMVRSTKTNPNENYPREILQLFTVGLYMLNQDGTLQLDDKDQPIPTYGQQTINDLSKVFTGWTFCNTTCPNSQPSILNYRDPMILIPANHDLTEKTLLTYPGAPHSVIPACANCTNEMAIRDYAKASLEAALDNIFHHPNVAPFISKLMIQHMVTSDPSPAYVARVAAAFNGATPEDRGEMKAVLRAILFDPEARGDIKTAPRYGKLREPVQLITNLARLFPARDFFGENTSDGALASYSTGMGQNPFYSPTVFNYFSPDYVVPGTTILAPEFDLFNTGTAVKRTNFLHTYVFDGLTPNATDSLRGTSLDYTEFVPLAAADVTGNQLLDALNAKMMHGALVPEQRQGIINAVLVVPDTNPLLRVKTAVYLIAASSQYQIQR